MESPQYAPLTGFPLAWSDSTNGQVTGKRSCSKIRDNDMEKFRLDLDKLQKEQAGRLKGRIVLDYYPAHAALQQEALAKRLSDSTCLPLDPDPQPPKEHDYSRLAVPEDPAERVSFLMNAP